MTIMSKLNGIFRASVLGAFVLTQSAAFATETTTPLNIAGSVSAQNLYAIHNQCTLGLINELWTKIFDQPMRPDAANIELFHGLVLDARYVQRFEDASFPRYLDLIRGIQPAPIPGRAISGWGTEDRETQMMMVVGPGYYPFFAFPNGQTFSQWRLDSLLPHLKFELDAGLSAKTFAMVTNYISVSTNPEAVPLVDQEANSATVYTLNLKAYSECLVKGVTDHAQ